MTDIKLFRRKVVFCLLMAPVMVFAEGIGGFSGAASRLTADAVSAGTGGITLFAETSSNSYAHNPAALAYAESRKLDASLVNLSLDRYVYVFNGSLPMPPTARLSAGIISAGTNQIQARDSRGYKAGTLSDSEMAYLIAFSNRFSDKLALGLTLKIVTRRLAADADWLDLKGSGFGAGVGLLYQVSEKSTLAMSIKDWNSSYNWKTDAVFEQGSSYQDAFPMSLALGWKQDLGDLVLALEHDYYLIGESIYRGALIWTGIQGIQLNAGLSYEDGTVNSGLSARLSKALIKTLPMHIDFGLGPGIRGEGMRTYMGWGVIF